MADDDDEYGKMIERAVQELVPKLIELAGSYPSEAIFMSGAMLSAFAAKLANQHNESAGEQLLDLFRTAPVDVVRVEAKGPSHAHAWFVGAATKGAKH